MLNQNSTEMFGSKQTVLATGSATGGVGRTSLGPDLARALA